MYNNNNHKTILHNQSLRKASKWAGMINHQCHNTSIHQKQIRLCISLSFQLLWEALNAVKYGWVIAAIMSVDQSNLGLEGVSSLFKDLDVWRLWSKHSRERS